MRNYRNWITACSDVIDGSPIPEVFRRWSAISAVAGALGRSVWLDRGAFRVYPNLYIAMIAQPGRGKSVSLLIPFGQLFPHISIPLGAGESSPAYTYYHQELGVDLPRRLSIARITPEKLAVDMSKINELDQMLSTFDQPHYDSSLTLITSEMGTFLQREDRNLQFFLTEGWDSPENYEYRTKTAGQYLIRGPSLNWLLCATPEQFVENMPANAAGQGLLSRIIPILHEGDPLPQRLKYDAPSQQKLVWLRQDLADIARLRGPLKWASAQDYEEVEDWVQNEAVKNAPKHPSLTGYNERRISHLCKVAIVLACATQERPEMSAPIWREAVFMLEEVEKNMPRVLGNFGLSDIGRATYDLAEMVKSVFKISGAGLPLDQFNLEILRRSRNASDIRTIREGMEAAGLIKVRGQIVVPISEATKKEAAQLTKREIA